MAFDRSPLGRRGRERIAVAVVCGALAYGLTALVAPWQLAALAGWAVAAAVILVWVWGHVARNPTPSPADIEEEIEPTNHARWWFLGAGLASLASVLLALVKSGRTTGAEQVLLSVGSVVTIALSWCVIQTEFMLRYAAEYYQPPEGGIEFPASDGRDGRDGGDGAGPTYLDFAYVAFTVGMTYQVSDTALQTRAVRRVALRHGVLSFVFGVVILGTTVNLIADLLRN